MELLQRAQRGDLDGVKTMIQQGVDVNTKNSCNQTALYFACEKGHTDVVKYLLDSGANVSLGASPLIAAVRNEHYECCKLLLEHRASVHCRNSKRESPMSVAVQKHHYSVILLLLQHGAMPSASLNDVAFQLLNHAKAEHAKAVQILIDQRFINLTPKSIFLAAFSFAFKCGSVELAEIMLSNNSYSKIDQLYPDATYHSAKNNWPTILSKLLEKKVNINALTDGQTPLYAACKEGHETVVTLLLNNGADPNVNNERRSTASEDFLFALYRASKAGHEDIARLLLDGDPEINGSSSRRPLHAACERGYTEIVDFLLQHGADSNASSTPSGIEMAACITSSSSLPICCAVHKGYTEIVKLLLNYGADMNKKDQSGKSALIYVVESLTAQRRKAPQDLNPLSAEMDFSILKYLLLAGGDVNMSSGHDNLSLLHIASSAGMCDLMTELIQHGANCNQLTSSGLSAVDLAFKNGHEAALELLLKNGAKPDGETGSMLSTRSVRSYYESNSTPPLCMAAKNSNETMVNILVKHGANVNASNEKGDTALHLATSTTVIETLLNAKANVNATNDKGETALSVVCEKRTADTNVVELLLKFGADPDIGCSLYIACINNDTDLVKLILAYGANANIVILPRQMPLHIACSNGNVAIVDCLLKNGADAAFADSDGKTALHFAVERLRERQGQQADSEEYDPIVTLLLQHDAPVNVVSSEGETPLCVACKKGLAGIIKQLLDGGADVCLNTTDSNKHPLLIACERNFRDVAITLLDRGAHASVSRDDDTPLKLATANGDVELVKQLIHYGADVNQLQDISDTALHVAMFRCTASDVCKPNDDGVSLDIVKALLAHGADPNVCPRYSYYGLDVVPPLSAASRCGNTALVILLLKFRARVSHRTELGRTALHYAIGYNDEGFNPRLESSNSKISIVEMLLSAGADANAMDKTGASPLYFECKRGMTKCVQLLLSRGANPNMKATDKYPMHAACRHQHYDLVKLLLEYNADVAVSDEHGKTALHCVLEYVSQSGSPSASRGILNLVQLLLESGADVNIASTDGETPFYVACLKGLMPVVAKMLEYGGTLDRHSGMKPLVAACKRRNVELVDVLLKNGAAPNLASASCYPHSKYRLPLCTAVTGDNSDELIVLLMNAGADVNALDREGNTALCIATKKVTSCYSSFKAKKKLISTIRLLLAHGADLNVLMPDGQSLLGLVASAIRRSQLRGFTTHEIELLQLMVKNGAILSDSFNLLGQNTSRQLGLHGMLRDLATFSGKHDEYMVELFQAGGGFQLIALCSHPGKAMSIRLCQAAVMTGYSPSSMEMQELQLEAASEDANGGVLDQLVNWLNEDRQRVPSLLRQCRVVIRRQLSLAVSHRSILTAIDKLPLPSCMKMYLLFQGTLTEVDLSVNRDLCNE